MSLKISNGYPAVLVKGESSSKVRQFVPFHSWPLCFSTNTMTCPSAEGFNSIAFLLPLVNHKQQLYPRAIACTCQHASTILCCAVTSSLQFNLFCSQSPQLPPLSCSRYFICELLPECDVVHTGSKGWWDELDDRWVVHSATVHLWKM